jgi:hypothetical protein
LITGLAFHLEQHSRSPFTFIMSNTAAPDASSNPGLTESGLSPDQTATLDLVALQISHLQDIGRLIEILRNSDPDQAAHIMFRAPCELRCFQDQTLYLALREICDCYEYLRTAAAGGQRLTDILEFMAEISPRLQLVITAMRFMLLNPASAHNDLYEPLAADVLAVDARFCRATIRSMHGEPGEPLISGRRVEERFL